MDSEHKAILTHYLHNIHNQLSNHYKDKATNILETFVSNNYKNISIVRESVLRQLLFEVENVPLSSVKTLHLLSLLTCLQELGDLELQCKM